VVSQKRQTKKKRKLLKAKKTAKKYDFVKTKRELAIRDKRVEITRQELKKEQREVQQKQEKLEKEVVKLADIREKLNSVLQSAFKEARLGEQKKKYMRNF